MEERWRKRGEEDERLKMGVRVEVKFGQLKMKDGFFFKTRHGIRKRFTVWGFDGC